MVPLCCKPSICHDVEYQLFYCASLYATIATSTLGTCLKTGGFKVSVNVFSSFEEEFLNNWRSAKIGMREVLLSAGGCISVGRRVE